MEALPAVLGGQAGGLGVGVVCGTWGGLARLGGGLPGLVGFARLGLGWLRLGLGRFRGGGWLGLGGHRWFALVLAGLRRLGGGGLGPGGQEGHLGVLGVLLAHLGAVDLRPLAGVAQLPHVPHHLGEVVARVEVVGTAQVGLALEVTVVGAAWVLALGGALAGDAQASIVPSSGHHHGANILSLGVESDGIVPDAALLRFVVVTVVAVVVVILSV